jgi:hypothetical protein
VLLAGLGIWMLASRPSGGDLFQVLFATLWFSVVALNAWRLCTAVREIEVHENDEVEFISWVQRVRLHAREILSVRLVPGRAGRIVVRHQAGTLTLAGSFDQFHRLLAELRQAQPAVEISGL